MSRKRLVLATVLVVPAALALAPVSSAHPNPVPLSGAIFTTDGTGTPVNLNIYDSKQDVYLNGGPGVNAPVGAAGLPAGTYSFQVTDPPGKMLLSTDPVECRQFTVDADGVITAAVGVPASCAHVEGTSGDDSGVSVQLYPFDDTPNNGGVYKVWVSPTSLLVSASDRSGSFGFVPHHSKTDNFKVNDSRIVEIDTRFWVPGYADPVDGFWVLWTDTVGASNIKYSEYDPAMLAFHEAHVEAAEQGRHLIYIEDQLSPPAPVDCVIDHVVGPTGSVQYPSNGSVTVEVNVKNHNAGDATYWVDVYCS